MFIRWIQQVNLCFNYKSVSDSERLPLSSSKFSIDPFVD